jgi:hypothetical protein
MNTTSATGDKLQRPQEQAGIIKEEKMHLKRQAVILQVRTTRVVLK